MKNVHLLPTDKPSKLFEILQFNFIFDNQNKYSEEYKKLHKYKNKNIYITNDEEIEKRDWVLYTNPNSKRTFVVKATEVTSSYFDYERLTLEIRQVPIKWAKKIILTTDPQLISDGVQAIDNEFLEWFVKNPSCEEIKIEKTFVTNSGLGYQEYAVLDSNFKVIEINAKIPQTSYCLGKVTILNTYEYVITYKIIIPSEEYKMTLEEEKEFRKKFPKEFALIDMVKLDEAQEEPKQETLEEANWKVIGTKDNTFYNGAKWQQERSYSEEEVIELLTARCKHFGTTLTPFRELLLKQDLEWFEQFKK
jgi:hypothetical protein